jgi:hypothetical protein
MLGILSITNQDPINSYKRKVTKLLNHHYQVISLIFSNKPGDHHVILGFAYLSACPLDCSFGQQHRDITAVS